ncbi:helicase C-terminal domain-containing protein [Nonomuraea rhodomycinica]|uniref:Helicase-associated domain-containing protein n=1 Tax=Nonomuraea rhodomycinica TaxID=1712872 RepID=A0A7Y6MDZ4_9ACTN|nr:helicase C-terminal domain-containing protein [Nonomuraea rhodomycinica]NUW43186.1 helicase-associated domain-containing protein [Nonomuraea rhodomycinica]
MEFTEWIRARSDAQLRALVSARPELITPVPAHLEGLAARAGSPSAIGRALDRLDRFTLAVVETLAVQDGPAPRETLADLVGRALAAGEPEPALGAALDRLRDLALVYGPDDALDLAPGVRKALDDPAGLGPTVAEVFRHHPPEQLDELADDIAPGTTGSGKERLAAALAEPAKLLEEVSGEARAALDQLAWGPATGRVPNARREVRIGSARSPIEQLLARGLLAATGEESVTLPREVGLHLRGGRVHRDLLAEPPALEGTAREQGLADRTAAGQAFAFVRVVEELCERWSFEPPGVLRTGGLGVRDMKRVTTELDVPEWAAALAVEVAHAAGLVAQGGGVDGEWLPTTGYDLWRVRSTADRWVTLALTWLTMDRVPGLVGERDERDRPLNALHPDLRRTAAPVVRAAALGVLASAPGLAPSRASVLDRMAWEQPRRRGPLREQLVEFALREAEQVGVTGLGVLSGHGRALMAAAGIGPGAEESAGTHKGKASGSKGTKGAAAKAAAGDPAAVLAPLLPEPVDHVLLQADLTAVAPGPLTSELNRWMTLAADVESKGGATVYRFSDASVRRALDAGQGADELLAALERHSATPVPQALSYLVADVARRHGRIRVGTASAYIRCDDPALLDQITADRRSASLRLRRLAPTVIASRTSRAALVDSLRAMGYAPVAESLDGDVIVSRLDGRRSEGPAQTRSVPASNGLDPEVAAAAVRALRAGDAAHLARREPVAAPGGAIPRGPATSTITALQDAIKQGVRVWIGYLDSQGNATSRILEPARMEGGYLTAYDETRAAVHRFALHRITGVAGLS